LGAAISASLQILTFKRISMGNHSASSWLSKNLVKPIHTSLVLGSRIQTLSQCFTQLMPKRPMEGLDVGCGSGELAVCIQNKRPDIHLTGVDVFVRKNTAIKVLEFDGLHLPFPDKCFDFVMISDVLHHTLHPEELIKECSRVARSYIFIKDHISDSKWDYSVLSFMDWVGNRGYEVVLPYNYLSTKTWNEIYRRTGLIMEEKIDNLHLYPQPFSLLFDSSLHFICRLAIT
jgi:SAM-dependent methyltransferase